MFPRIDYQVTLGCLWPNCQDGFKNTKELINHVRAAHSPELKCPYCNKNAKYGAGLIHHVRVHTGEKPYFCPVNGCKFRSATKNNLKVHLSGKMHGMDILMNFAHIFDRPRKKRRITDLPDIIVKKHKSSIAHGMPFPMMPMSMFHGGPRGMHPGQMGGRMHHPGMSPAGVPGMPQMKPNSNPQNMLMHMMEVADAKDKAQANLNYGNFVLPPNVAQNLNAVIPGRLNIPKLDIVAPENLKVPTVEKIIAGGNVSDFMLEQFQGIPSPPIDHKEEKTSIVSVSTTELQ